MHRVRLISCAGAVVLLAFAMTGCSTSSSGRGTALAPTTKLVLLTRDGCMNTDALRANLDSAIARLDKRVTYEVVDQDTLSDADPRRGYPTPTLLYANRDLFGLPEPTPPFPEPT